MTVQKLINELLKNGRYLDRKVEVRSPDTLSFINYLYAPIKTVEDDNDDQVYLQIGDFKTEFGEKFDKRKIQRQAISDFIRHLRREGVIPVSKAKEIKACMDNNYI